MQLLVIKRYDSSSCYRTYKTYHLQASVLSSVRLGDERVIGAGRWNFRHMSATQRQEISSSVWLVTCGGEIFFANRLWEQKYEIIMAVR